MPCHFFTDYSLLTNHVTRLNVPVVDGLRVVGPVVVALFPALLDAARQHDDGPRVRLPAHPPEVVPRRVEGTLRHDELPRRVVPGNEIGVDEVGAFLIIGGLKEINLLLGYLILYTIS